MSLIAVAFAAGIVVPEAANSTQSTRYYTEVYRQAPAVPVSPGAPVTFAPNDANVYYSPFAWHVTINSASTINSAAYIRFMTSGTFLNFKFDVSKMVSPGSEIYWKVDNGPATLSLVRHPGSNPRLHSFLCY